MHENREFGQLFAAFTNADVTDAERARRFRGTEIVNSVIVLGSALLLIDPYQSGVDFQGVISGTGGPDTLGFCILLHAPQRDPRIDADIGPCGSWGAGVRMVDAGTAQGFGGAPNEHGSLVIRARELDSHITDANRVLGVELSADNLSDIDGWTFDLDFAGGTQSAFRANPNMSVRNSVIDVRADGLHSNYRGTYAQGSEPTCDASFAETWIIVTGSDGSCPADPGGASVRCACNGSAYVAALSEPGVHGVVVGSAEGWVGNRIDSTFTNWAGGIGWFWSGGTTSAHDRNTFGVLRAGHGGEGLLTNMTTGMLWGTGNGTNNCVLSAQCDASLNCLNQGSGNTFACGSLGTP